MTDREKLDWLKEQLFALQDYVSEQSSEVVGDTDLDNCIWHIINGYGLFDYGAERVAVEW